MNEPFFVFKNKSSSKQILLFLATVTISALCLRLMIGYITVHYFDLNYYIDWSSGVQTDFFGAYNNIQNLDYPPLFLFFLYWSGKLTALESVVAFEPYMMLVLKGWQILFDVAIIPLLYIVLRSYGTKIALLGACLWAVNSTIILNSSYWGQTDSIMIFFLLLTFWLLEDHKFVWAGVCMALACLMKFQCLYFAPIFLLFLIGTGSLKQWVQTVVAGTSVVLAVLFPFMLRSGWKLPFDIYFGGFKQYSKASLNAFNFYSAFGLNDKPSDTGLFGFLTADALSVTVLVLILILLVGFFFSASEKSSWLLAFLMMQTIFMFTARMHERYQIPVLMFALVASIYHKSFALFGSYAALTVMTFCNHFFVLQNIFLGEQSVGWLPYYDFIVIVFSFLNMILYFATFWISLCILYRNGYLGLSASFQKVFSNR